MNYLLDYVRLKLLHRGGEQIISFTSCSRTTVAPAFLFRPVSIRSKERDTLGELAMCWCSRASVNTVVLEVFEDAKHPQVLTHSSSISVSLRGSGGPR